MARTPVVRAGHSGEHDPTEGLAESLGSVDVDVDVNVNVDVDVDVDVDVGCRDDGADCDERGAGSEFQVRAVQPSDQIPLSSCAAHPYPRYHIYFRTAR